MCNNPRGDLGKGHITQDSKENKFVAVRIDIFESLCAEFAESELGDVVHKAMVEEYLSEQIIGHISRDAAAIVGNEKPANKDKDKKEEERKVETPKCSE